MDEIKPMLIVGLGNPGTRYERTRHNVGFMALDVLAEPDADWRSEHKALVVKIQLKTQNSKLKTILAKPQTFMNLSGQAVQALMAFYKIPLENLIVIHDDVDLHLGDVREKVGGGSAGHNGIRSIDASVGNNYRRIRLGVGRPEKQEGIFSFFNFRPVSTADWVLGKFSDDELKKINPVLANLAGMIG